jgi:hypothetical protein
VRRGLISVVIVVAFVAIFALSRHHSTPPTTTTTTTSATSTSSTTTSNPGTDCLGSDFKAIFLQGQGAAGTVYASVTLTRTGAGSCTVKGFPILTSQDNKGGVLPINQIDLGSASAPIQFQPARANEAPRSITLVKGASTNFSFAYNDVQTGTTACENVVTLNVEFTSTGTSVPVTPAYPLQPCDNGKIWVSPFY